MTVLRRQNESRKWFLPLFVENCHFSPRPLSEKSGRHFSPILPLLGSQKKWRPQIPQIPSTFRAHKKRVFGFSSEKAEIPLFSATIRSGLRDDFLGCSCNRQIHGRLPCKAPCGGGATLAWFPFAPVVILCSRRS